MTAVMQFSGNPLSASNGERLKGEVSKLPAHSEMSGHPALRELSGPNGSYRDPKNVKPDLDQLRSAPSCSDLLRPKNVKTCSVPSVAPCLRIQWGFRLPHTTAYFHGAYALICTY